MDPFYLESGTAKHGNGNTSSMASATENTHELPHPSSTSAHIPTLQASNTPVIECCRKGGHKGVKSEPELPGLSHNVQKTPSTSHEDITSRSLPSTSISCNPSVPTGVIAPASLQRPAIIIRAQSSSGSLNRQSPISIQEFQRATVVQFFKIVNSRSTQPLAVERLARLVIIQSWGERERFIVGKKCTEELWQVMKENILDNVELVVDLWNCAQELCIWVGCEV